MARRLTAAVLIIGIWTAAVLAAVPPFNTARFYSEAAFQAAIKPYTDAIARDARDVDAHYWLGIAYLYIAKQYRMGLVTYGGDFAARAIRSLEQAAGLSPTPRVLVVLAEVYGMVGDFQKRQATLDRLFALSRPAPPK